MNFLRQYRYNQHLGMYVSNLLIKLIKSRRHKKKVKIFFYELLTRFAYSDDQKGFEVDMKTVTYLTSKVEELWNY